MVDFKIVGNRIRKARREKHLTQQQLAELLGSNEKYISNIETGRCSCSLSMLLEIANILDTGTDNLLGSNLKCNIDNLTGKDWEGFQEEYQKLSVRQRYAALRFMRFMNEERDEGGTNK